jgi:hypothetical protein
MKSLITAPARGRVAAVIVVAAVLLVLPAAVAWAEDDKAKAPFWGSFITVTDTHGIPVWNHQLSLDRGGVFDIAKYNWSFIVDGWWGNYQTFCYIALWFINFVMSFEWISLIAAPVIMIGDAVHSVISSIGLVPVFLAVMALSSGLWVLRGKNTTALFEFLIASLIAALATGVLSDPVRMVAGTDGLIVQAAQTGQAIAAELTAPGAGPMTPEQLRQEQTGALVDIFVRQPTQLVNYGRIIDGTNCEDEYDAALRGGPYAQDDDDIRSAMAKCDKALGDYAADPNASMATSAFVFSFAGVALIALAIAIGVAVITAAFTAMFQSLKSVLSLVTALLPGARGSLLLNITHIAMSLLIIVFSAVFLSLGLLVIQEMLIADFFGLGLTERLLIIDIAMVIGIGVFLWQRKRLKDAPYGLAEKLAWRPGGRKATVNPTSLPKQEDALNLPTMANLTTMGSNIMHMGFLRKSARAAQRDPVGPIMYVDNRHVNVHGGGGQPPTNPGAGATPAGPAGGNPPGSAGGLPAGGGLPAPGGPGTPPAGPTEPGAPTAGGLPSGPATPGDRLLGAGKKATGVLVRAGTSAALAYATGGASTAVIGGAKTVKAISSARQASRRALQARIAGATPPPPAAPRPTTPAVQPAASPVRAAGKTPPEPAPETGKTPERPGKTTPAPVILKPGDAGYLTSQERLRQGRQANETSQPAAAQDDWFTRLRRQNEGRNQ